MIETYDLNILLKEFGINPERVLKKNSNIIDNGHYNDIKRVLNYLINELKISPANIEKCPSVMYRNVDSVKSNYEFLKKSKVNNYDIETCLHILSTDPIELRKTYDYVLTNYGVELLNRITSILAVDISRINDIEEIFSNYNILSKPQILSACISRFDINEIKRVIDICLQNNIEIIGSIFLKSAEEIQKIVRVCKENNIEITGSVFRKSAVEIEKIISVCKKYNIEITATIFYKTAKEIEKIVSVCKKCNIEITGSVFFKTAEEIEKIVLVCKKYNIEITATVFLKTAEEIEKIVLVCKNNNIEIAGSIFTKKASKLEETINFLKEKYSDKFLISRIIISDKKYIEKVFFYLESLGVLDIVINSSSILTLTLDEIIERKQFIENIGESIVVNGKFNSIFSLSRKKYQKRKEMVATKGK